MHSKGLLVSAERAVPCEEVSQGWEDDFAPCNNLWSNVWVQVLVEDAEQPWSELSQNGKGKSHKKKEKKKERKKQGGKGEHVPFQRTK